VIGVSDMPVYEIDDLEAAEITVKKVPAGSGDDEGINHLHESCLGISEQKIDYSQSHKRRKT